MADMGVGVPCNRSGFRRRSCLFSRGLRVGCSQYHRFRILNSSEYGTPTGHKRLHTRANPQKMMKVNRFAWLLLLIVLANGCGKQLSSQSSTNSNATNKSTLRAETIENVFEDTKAKAEKGDVQAQYSLGVMYVKGDGVSQDYAEAVTWFRKAAEKGNANAQSGLGSMYADGLGVTQSYAEAVKWYRKAAEQGLVFAQFRLAYLYAQGDGVTNDEVEAVKWFRRAAEQGDAAAQLT